MRTGAGRGRRLPVSGRETGECDGEVRELSPEELLEEGEKAREKALYNLQFSAKTETEMRKKLAEQGFSPASIESTVNFLKEYRYLDDEDYARRYIEKNCRKKSRRQMTFDLQQKGIPSEVTELLFEEETVDEEGQILALLEKKRYAGAEAGREERQKISAFLARKGFSYETISAALNHYARKDTE